MRIYTPDGEIGDAPGPLAAPRSVMSGARIGILDNTKPNAGVLLAQIAERIAERTGATVSPVETKNAALAAPDDVIARLEKEVDVVLTGSAD
ncbi:MAG: hypothetical protein P8J50_03490 [Acidimicrobiales bacterium]|mgnify:CR=1 FL=1|jgi:hypothetical protein|nr:hypothetical protein [Acidimicrobiales bacterium]